MCAYTRWIFISNLVIVEQNGKRDCSWYGRLVAGVRGAIGRMRSRFDYRGGVKGQKAIFTTGGHANSILNTDKKTDWCLTWNVVGVKLCFQRKKRKTKNNYRVWKLCVAILYARMSSALHVIYSVTRVGIILLSCEGVGESVVESKITETTYCTTNKT